MWTPAAAQAWRESLLPPVARISIIADIAPPTAVDYGRRWAILCQDSR